MTENGVQFTGSTGSLPSIGSSVAEEAEDKPHPPNTQSATMTTPVIHVIGEDLYQVAHDLVWKTIHSALARLRQEQPH